MRGGLRAQDFQCGKMPLIEVWWRWPQQMAVQSSASPQRGIALLKERGLV